jgi:hypothetical protein
MTIITSDTFRPAEFILSEASGQRSRENITVTQTGAALKSGTVLTKNDTGPATAAATDGNTGNPTFGAITVGVAAIAGAYNLTFTAATKFDVEDPAGVKIGTGTTGVAFSKAGIGFTLTAGATPAVAGDEFIITVAAGDGKYKAYTANGAAGKAVGILYNPLPAATGDVKAVGFVRDCEVIRSVLVGVDASAITDLGAVGVIVRGAA